MHLFIDIYIYAQLLEMYSIWWKQFNFPNYNILDSNKSEILIYQGLIHRSDC